MALKPIYEPDPSHTAKHRGTSEEARIEKDDAGRPVGKCPKDIDHELAQRLLDDGIWWSPKTHRGVLPLSVYNTYKGVPYRAHRRGRTRFYHGFPDVKNRIPKAIRDQLRQRAARENAADAFDRWMRQTEEHT